MNESFYLRKRDLKVIAVHIFDYSLVSECKSDYNSGLTKDEEREVKEAIIAQEKNYDTHIAIPRLSKEERFKIIEQFIQLLPEPNQQLRENYNDLIRSTEKYEMDYLTNGIDNERLKSQWNEFYRAKIKTQALNWLDHQKRQIEGNV